MNEDEQPVTKKWSRRKRRWVLGLSIVGGLIVLLIIAAFVTAHFTSASSFCDTCHEMDKYYATWQTSEHATAECRDCHIPPGAVPYIETKLGSFREIYIHFWGDPDAPLAVTREIPNESCFRCHDDPPADPSLLTVTFSHDSHRDAYCITCHVRLVHKGVPPLEYRDPAEMSSCFVCHDGKTAANTCSYCHTPPHEERGECSSCHTTSGWTSAAADHPFALTGAHADLDCARCHVGGPGVANIPGTNLPQAQPTCISCHQDEHGGLTDCAACHTPTAWKNADFEHPFPRTGAHAELTCPDCHVSKPGGATVPGTQFPAADPACVSCHEDEHGGLTDCAGCHAPTAWEDVDFEHPFPRTGAHEGLTCTQCHEPGGATIDGTQFPAASPRCVSCHGDHHKGLTDCADCHKPTSWGDVSFRHPVVGEHGRGTGISCVRCHPNGYGSHYCSCHGGNPPSDD